MGLSKDILYSVPQVDLHQVTHGQQQYLSKGPFSISLEHNDDEQQMMAEVAGYRWLVATHLACLKSNEYTYIFTVEGQADFFFCILVAPDTPADILAGLDEFLKAVTAYTAVPHAEVPAVPAAPSEPAAIAQPVAVQPAAAPTTKTGMVISGIQTASAIVALGVMRAAELASRGIERGAQMAVVHTKPNQTPSQISPSMKANLHRAKTVTGAAASVTKTVAVGVGSMVGTLAGTIVKSVSDSSKPGAPPPKTSSMKEIGRAGIIAASDLVDAMEAAALLVVTSSSSATAKVIEHRYGSEAAAASRDGLDAAKHMLEAALAMRQLKTKAILKATAKKTAAGLVQAPVFQPPGASVPPAAPYTPPTPIYAAAEPTPSAPGAAFHLPEPSVVNGVPVGGAVGRAAVAQAPQYPTHVAAPGGLPMYPIPQ